MNFIKIAWRDIVSIFKNRFIRVSVTAIIIVPLLYSLLYLYAFWDPYSKLQDVPVAIVNLDKGSVKDGTDVNYGNDLVKNLKDNDKMGWKFVSKEDAEEGVKEKDYYAMFIIPEDFSTKVVSAKDGKPEEPNITYTANEKKNFLAAQINGKVLTELKAEITKNITKEYTKVTFDNLYELKDGMQKAADGSKELKDGIVTAKDGSSQINDGVGTLKTKVDDGIALAGLHPELKSLVDASNAVKTRKVLQDGLALKDIDTSMLDMVNETNVGLATKSASDVSGLMNSQGVKTIMNIPSLQVVLSQMDFTKSGNVDALKERVNNVESLLSDVAVLQSAVSKIDQNKLNAMLAPLATPEMQSVLKDPVKLNAMVTNANNLIGTANNLNTVVSKVDSDKLKALVAPLASPQMQAILSDPAKLDGMVTNAGQLIDLANNVNGLLTKVDGTKLTNMVSPFMTPQMQAVINDPTQLNALVNNTNNLITTASVLNDTLKQVDGTKLNAMLQPLFTPQMQAILNDDTKLTGMLANAQALIKTAGDLNTILNGVDGNSLNTALTTLSPVLSDSTKLTSLTNMAKTASAVGSDAATIQGMQYVLSNASKMNDLLTTSTAMSNKVNISDADKTTLANVPDAQLTALNTNKQALINVIASEAAKGNIDPTTAQSLTLAVTIGSDISPAVKDLVTVQGKLADPSIAQIQTVLSGMDANKVTAMNSLLTGVKDNAQVLGALPTVLTTTNANSLLALQPITQNYTTIKNTLSSNLPLLQAISPTLTVDNVKNVKPLLGLAPQFDTMKTQLNGGVGLLNTVKPSLTADNISNAAPLLSLVPKYDYLKGQLNGNIGLLNTVKPSLTTDNVANVLPLMSLTSNFDGMKKDLGSNIGLLNTIKPSLTTDNVANLMPLLSVTSKFDSIKSDIAKNESNLALLNDLMQKANDPSVKAILPQIQTLQQDLQAAKPLLTQLSSQDYMNKIAGSPALVTQLTSMQKDLKNSSDVMTIAQNALSDGNIKMANDLIASIPVLTDGVNKLYDGTNKLNDGMTKLADGSKELNDKLTEGSDKLNKNLVNDSDTMSTFISEPLKMDEKPMFPVKNYGTGFAPYFIPLSLWIGALMMFFVITEKVDEDIKASSASIVLGKYLSYSYIGIIQAVLASAVVIALGLRPANVPLYFLFNIFMSFVFIAIIQCLVFLLGMAGRLLSIILLIFQLTSCAGTFPLEVVPPLFKVLNPFMPFTYCVSALREVISGMNGHAVFMKDVSVLAAFMIVFLAISVLMKGHADKVQEKIKEKAISMAS